MIPEKADGSDFRSALDFSEESRIWECLALLALFVTLLWMGPVNIWDKDIDHGFPYGFYAQDAFIFTSYQYYLVESGSWKNLAPYLARGHTDVVQAQPPMLEILSVLLAQATGFGFYTTTYIIVMLLVFLAVFCFYFVIRTFNPGIALLSLPLNVLLFAPTFITAFTWGNWPFFAGSAMLVFFFWCLNRADKRGVWALLALALSAVAFAHTSEYFFAGFAIAAILVFQIIRSCRAGAFKISEFWNEWKGVVLSGIVSIIIAGFYLLIFVQTFLHDYQPQYLTPESQGLSLFVSVTTPGVLLSLSVLAGIVLGVLMMFRHRAVQIGLVMFLIGFTNYVGTGKRGLETRYFWPVYLSIFIGLLAYFVLSRLSRQRLSLRVCAITGIILTVLLANNYYQDVSGPGLLSKESWQGMEWLAKNTLKNASVLYVYGDAYGQAAVLFNTRRNSDVILLEDYAAMAQKGQLKRVVRTERVFDHTADIPYRTGLLAFGFYKDSPGFVSRGESDFCGFDYYVIDKVSRLPGAVQFNTIIAQGLEQKANFSRAYENAGVLVLRNPLPGGDCVV